MELHPSFEKFSILSRLLSLGLSSRMFTKDWSTFTLRTHRWGWERCFPLRNQCGLCLALKIIPLPRPLWNRFSSVSRSRRSNRTTCDKWRAQICARRCADVSAVARFLNKYQAFQTLQLLIAKNSGYLQWPHLNWYFDFYFLNAALEVSGIAGFYSF